MTEHDKKEWRKKNMATIFLILGILCLLYCGGILISGAYGSWFFLIWGAAGMSCLLVFFLIHSGTWAALPVWARRGTVAVVLVGVAFFLFIEGLILSGFWKKGEEDLDYLIVLGAQMWSQGPSKALRLRLDTAYDYLAENEDTIVIVSGGKGEDEPMSEAQGMYDYLVGRGVAAQRILLEDASTNTHENLKFSRELIESEEARVGIVTNNFHVYRSTRLAAALGYRNVCGISAPSHMAMQANNMFREFFGVMKDWLFGNMSLW